jgi:iron complex transport system substrate-binding protein
MGRQQPEDESEDLPAEFLDERTSGVKFRESPKMISIFFSGKTFYSMHIVENNSGHNFLVIPGSTRNLSNLTDLSFKVVETTEQKNLSFYHNISLRVLIALLFLLTGIAGFSQSVNKVISFAPSITENIYLLGAEDKLVGCTSYCTQAISDGVEQIGSTVNINIEKVFALQPDLVLAMQLTKPQDIEAMKKLGIKVEMLETPASFDEICKQTIYIGRLIGEQGAAQKIITQTKHTVDSLKQLCLQIPKQHKIFFQIGANPIFTVLENTFMNDYILFCKGENIANGMKHGTMTRESVIQRNPDVIIIATMGGFGKEEQNIWKSFNELKAADNNKIFLIDSETACSPTPVNFAKAFANVYRFVKD